MPQLLIRFSQRLSEFGAILAAIVIASMFALILYEIALRSIFSSSTYILDEMVGYGVAASTFLGLGYALNNGSLIRVNLIISIIKNNRVRRLLEMICVTLITVINVLVIHGFWKSIIRNYQRGSVSETVAEVPLWIPEAILFTGLCIFAFQVIVYGLVILTNRPLIGDQDNPLTLEDEG